MWNIFREFIWDKAWGKVVSVFGLLELGYSLYLLVSPDDIKVLKLAQIDDRWWYGLGFVFLGSLVLLALNAAKQYKKQLETTAQIRLVYNEKLYPVCRMLEDDIEIIRIGFRVIGKNPIIKPVVFPSNLFRIDSTSKYTRMPIIQTPLCAMGQTDEVKTGRTPSYWLNVLEHKCNSNVIKLCYANYRAKPIELSPGRYQLDLVAKGEPSGSTITSSDVMTLYINIDDKNVLNIDVEGADQWRK